MNIIFPIIHFIIIFPIIHFIIDAVKKVLWYFKNTMQFCALLCASGLCEDGKKCDGEHKHVLCVPEDINDAIVEKGYHWYSGFGNIEYIDRAPEKVDACITKIHAFPGGDNKRLLEPFTAFRDKLNAIVAKNTKWESEHPWEWRRSQKIRFVVCEQPPSAHVNI